jgi:hypothetical protein
MRAFTKKRQPAPPPSSSTVDPAQMDIEHDAPAVH